MEDNRLANFDIPNLPLCERICINEMPVALDVRFQTKKLPAETTIFLPSISPSGPNQDSLWPVTWRFTVKGSPRNEKPSFGTTQCEIVTPEKG